jgi:transcriptional regulator with PAS, ATPase and Fis domain
MGTIFLDEIGDMPMEMQPKLLRVLEMKEVERLGSTKTIPTDFRVIAATNQNLEKLTRSGMFRADLYYRLNAVQIILEPLRKRKEDIVPLAYHFIHHAEKGPTGKGVRFRSKVRQAMENYDWPGNGRELKYFTESLLFRTEKALIDYSDLPNHIKTHSGLSHHEKGTSLRDYLKEAEKIAILEALSAADNNKTRAADLLGIHRTLLYRKMKQLDIVPTTLGVNPHTSRT